MARLVWILPLVLGACRAPAADVHDMSGFDSVPPIEGADPSVRHDERVELPTRIRARRDGTRVAYGIDTQSLQPVTLRVGEKMVLGARLVWSVRRAEAEPEWISMELGDLPLDVTGTGWWGGEPKGATFEAAIEVFETDIPSQHLWSPESGQYRVLWRRTLRAGVPG